MPEAAQKDSFSVRSMIEDRIRSQNGDVRIFVGSLGYLKS